MLEGTVNTTGSTLYYRAFTRFAHHTRLYYDRRSNDGDAQGIGPTTFPENIPALQ